MSTSIIGPSGSVTFPGAAGPDNSLTEDEFKRAMVAAGYSEELAALLYETYRGTGTDTEMTESEFTRMMEALKSLGGNSTVTNQSDLIMFILDGMTSNPPRIPAQTFEQFAALFEGILTTAEITVLFQTFAGPDGQMSAEEAGRLKSQLHELAGSGGDLRQAASALYMITLAARLELGMFNGAVAQVAAIENEIESLSQDLRKSGNNLSDTVAISTQMGVLNSRLTATLSVISDIKNMLRDAARPQ